MSVLKYLQEQLVQEESRLTIYHGDNHGLNAINGNYKVMNLEGSNQQEGPGIYFAVHKSTALGYGDKVVETTVNPKKFLPSREYVEDHLSVEVVGKILKEMYKEDEDLWYLLTDYGVYVTEPEEVEEHHWDELAEMLMNEQIRNFLITLVDASNTKTAVSNFVKYSGYWGTYMKMPATDYSEADTWFAIMHNDDNVRPVEN